MSDDTKKGGKKTAPREVADRIDTPDGINVEEVLAATRRMNEERELRRRHMNDCPAPRGGECACPANLLQMPPPLEAEKLGDVTLVRVDDGREVKTTITDKHEPSGVREVTKFLEPKWICTTCGCSYRAPKLLGHLCDPAFLLWKERKPPASLGLTAEQRFGGAYRLTIHRDAAGVTHLREVVIDGDRIVSDIERTSDGDFLVVEGALSDAVAEEFSS